MKDAFLGRCACGAVRFSTSHRPVFQNLCQCRDCQRRSGAGHGCWLTFAGRDGMSVQGEVRVWHSIADSGAQKHLAFCPICGTPVHLTFSTMPDLIAVPAGSLDHPGRFAPQAVTYAARGHAWDATDAGLPRFDRMPGG